MILKVTPCAFHSSQLITNFCSSPECLLPMCPKCIRVHSQQHLQSSTKPQFQTITTVVKQVEKMYTHMQKLFERASEQLLEVQTYKKKNEQQVRRRLAEAREKLIKEFERQLVEAEEAIVKQIIGYSEEVVDGLRGLDEEIDCQIGAIENAINDLYSDRCLKNIINYYAQDWLGQANNDISSVNQRIQALNRQGIQLELNDKELLRIQGLVRSYMSVHILKREDDQRSQHQREQRQHRSGQKGKFTGEFS